MDNAAEKLCEQANWLVEYFRYHWIAEMKVISEEKATELRAIAGEIEQLQAKLVRLEHMNPILVDDVQKSQVEYCEVKAKLDAADKQIEQLQKDHCQRCGQRPPHESLNCPTFTVWECLDAERKFFASASAELDRKKKQLDAALDYIRNWESHSDRCRLRQSWPLRDCDCGKAERRKAILDG